MSEQVVITEKASQARDVRAAVGGRYGAILPAEGHLLDLVEPEDVDPAWKRWAPVLLRPEGLYGTKPAAGGNKAAKLRAIRDALRRAKRVWLATDCDREGQLIGQEILEHCRYRGEVRRVMFTAQDPQTIREAFERAKPNEDYARLYAAAVARRQADQIYNLSLTRTATVTIAQRPARATPGAAPGAARGARSVIGVGRVKTPTLAIVCRRELEIRRFVPQTYFEVVATAEVAPGTFRMRYAPEERILKREDAEAVAALARDFEGPLQVEVETKRQAPPRLHDLPSLQKLCGARFGWSAAKTLEIAQELYDGAGKKVITYPRAETRYLPEALIGDVPRIVAGLRVGRAFAQVPVPEPPVVRRGAGGTFSDAGLQGASHHAVIPNVNTVDELKAIWPRLSADERRLFDAVARAYLAAVMPDYRYRQTTAVLDVRGHAFRATGRQTIEAGWRAAFPDWQPAEERGEDAQALPPLRDGEPAALRDPEVEAKQTRPPPRYGEGTLVQAMQNAWRFVEDEALRERLREAKGIGTPATRAEIIRGLKAQDFLALDGKQLVPTERGLALFELLQRADPALVDPGVTARLECLLDDVLVGRQEMLGAIDAVCAQASRIIGRLTEGPGEGAAPLPPVPPPSARPAAGRTGRPSRSRPREPSAERPGRAAAPRNGAARGKSAPASPRRSRRIAAGEHAAPSDAAPSDAARSDAVPSDRDAPPPGEARHGHAAGDTGDGPAQIPADARGAPRVQTRKRRGRSVSGTTGRSSGPDAPVRRATASAGSDDAPGQTASPAGETPLRIPFGNKEAAMRLGARYRAGGWYAPPGTDLGAFRERGWL